MSFKEQMARDMDVLTNPAEMGSTVLFRRQGCDDRAIPVVVAQEPAAEGAVSITLTMSRATVSRVFIGSDAFVFADPSGRAGVYIADKLVSYDDVGFTVKVRLAI